MTVRVAENGVILLDGLCTIEDAAVLLDRLSENPDAQVDWRECEHAHTAVIQILAAVRPRTIGRPGDPFIRNFLADFFEEAR